MNMQNLKNRIYSGDNMVSLSDVRYLPRWVVLAIDVMILMTAVSGSFYLLEKLHVHSSEEVPNYTKYLLILVVNTIYMYIFKTYSGIIRHSTFIDLFKIMLANVLTGITLGILNIITFIITGNKLFLPTFLFIYFTISVTLLFMFRLFVKEFFHFARELRRTSLKKRILVLGIDEQAIAVARALLDNPSLPYHVAGFLTQRTDSKSAKLLGRPIYNRKKLENYTKDKLDADGVLIIEEMMTKEEMNHWVNLFLEKDLEVFKSPPVQKLRDDIRSSIKNLQIEDLLNRKPIKIENEEVPFCRAILNS